MLVIVLNINLFLLAGLILVAFFVGYLLRGNQLRKNQDKIYELEQEMLSNHARILELEKENALLKKPETPEISREAVVRGESVRQR